jgi:hypothetical protein
MAKLEVDGSVYNVRKSWIRTRMRFPHVIRETYKLAGFDESEASEEVQFFIRTFAFTVLDVEHVSGPEILPIIDPKLDPSGVALEQAWEQFQYLDAITYSKDFWDAHIEAQTPLNDPAYTPEAAADILSGEKKA